MTLTLRRIRLAALPLLVGIAPPLPTRDRTVPLTPEAWIATDGLRFRDHLGRHAMYIDRGVALVRGATMADGTLELDVAATDTTNFLGVTFRAAGPRFSNVVFLRPGASGTGEAVQYGPALNSLGVAWQVYHGDGANAVAEIPRNRWIRLRIELDGPVARIFVDSATAPTLVVPRVVASGGEGFGVWTGPFGRGAYFSNIRYSPRLRASTAALEPEPPAAGTIREWELSNSIEAADFMPSDLPGPDRLTWQRVETEPEGFVLINRYREAPVGGVPRDSTGAVLVDSVMTGRIAGCRVVYARTTIAAVRAETRRLHYTYSNGVVVYLNRRPLAMAMNPGGLRSNLGVMARAGDALYLPLERGDNQLVLAVIQCTGGWAVSARLDPSGKEAADGDPGLPAIAEVVNGRVEATTYRGVRALKLVPSIEAAGKDGDMMALLDGPEFTDGTIEARVAGAPRPGAAAGSRGFVGISFRTGPHGAWSDVFYLRPTNGRADDQLRRNHAVQYASDPEYPWHRLRQESPGVYEAYADLEPGVWTTMRIVVQGSRARLYLDGGSQPALIVNDLKHGARPGRIALWAHVETEAYFGPVIVTGAEEPVSAPRR